MEVIISRYLQHIKSPSFNDFVEKNERKIIKLSTTANSKNAFKLMTLWINKYNKTVKKTRPTAPLQKKLNKTTIAFKGIYILTSAQKTANRIIEADSYKTSTAYVLKTNKILRTSVSDEDENEEEEPF